MRQEQSRKAPQRITAVAGVCGPPGLSDDSPHWAPTRRHAHCRRVVQCAAMSRGVQGNALQTTGRHSERCKRSSRASEPRRRRRLEVGDFVVARARHRDGVEWVHAAWRRLSARHGHSDKEMHFGTSEAGGHCTRGRAEGESRRPRCFRCCCGYRLELSICNPLLTSFPRGGHAELFTLLRGRGMRGRRGIPSYDSLPNEARATWDSAERINRAIFRAVSTQHVVSAQFCSLVSVRWVSVG